MSSELLMGRLLGSVAVVTAALSLSACSGGQTAHSEEPPPIVAATLGEVPGAPASVPLPVGADIPAFSGPWAGDFEAAYRTSTSDLQRQVLQDGTISDQEIAALQDALTDVLADRGFTKVAYGAGGTFALKPPPGMAEGDFQRLLDSCIEAVWGPNGGYVYALAFQIQRNPAGEDEAQLMAGCLVRQGLVDAGYTGDDYRRDMENGTAPYDTEGDAFTRCISNPTSGQTT